MAEVMEIVRGKAVGVMGGGEVESCGLEARQRRSLRCENDGEVEDHEEALEEKKKKEVEFGEEGGRSVFFDQHQGIWKCQHCIWTYQMCFPNIEPVQKHEDFCNALMDIKNSLRRGSENGTLVRGLNSDDQKVILNSEFLAQFVASENDRTEFEANEFNGLADVLINNQSQTLMKTSVDNGSSSYVFSETKTETTTTTLKTEIEEVVKAEHKSKFQVTEFDVERVLEEQETHDLFCPNCKSCITKRVILRKRKRTIQESKYDFFKHQKVPDTNTDLNVTPIWPEKTDDDTENKREVFGCFQCFRFFTVKDGGFDICGIFRRREEEMPLLDPIEVHTTKWSWFSIFGIKTRKLEENMTVHGERIIPNESVDDLNDFRIPEPGKELSEEPKDISGKDLPGAHLIEIPETEVYEEQNITEQKVIDPNRDKAKGKESSEGLYVNSDKNKPDTHSIYIPGSDVHGESSGDDFITSVEGAIAKPIGPATDVNVPDPGVIPSSSGIIIDQEKDQGPKERIRNEWDILKSIVYGGLIESITSLGVVSSAAGSDASTLNIVALGLANLIGGLFVIIHNLYDLKKERHETRDEEESESAGQYWELLGRQKNFRRHVIMAVISYLIFGLLPPVIYGFSFWKSDNKEYKIIAIAAASLLCIALLAIGKAHVRLEKDYFKCLTYYIGLGVTASGLSFVAGVMIHRFLTELGLFDPQPDVRAPPFDGFLLNRLKSPFSSSY